MTISLYTILSDLQATQMASVAVFVLMVYDHGKPSYAFLVHDEAAFITMLVITLGDEVCALKTTVRYANAVTQINLIWTARLSFVKVIFFFVSRETIFNTNDAESSLTRLVTRMSLPEIIVSLIFTFVMCQYSCSNIVSFSPVPEIAWKTDVLLGLSSIVRL